MAVTGHQGEREVSTYTKGTQRRILAAAAMEKLRASLSHPVFQVRQIKENSQ
jgi:hypothetical protein